MTTSGDLALIDPWKTKRLSAAEEAAPGVFRTVAEYFAGVGLVRLGLERAGWKVIFANDFSLQKFEMYQGYYPDASDHYLIEDILNLGTSDVPLTLLATSSFPCIDLSLAGNLNGIHGEHSSAFWGFIRILKAQASLSPILVLVENVPGWLSSNQGDDFRLTVKALNDLGYACDAFVLDARRFTPQSRLRVFLIGVKQPLLKMIRDLIDHRSPSLTTKRLQSAIDQNLGLNWLKLPIPEPPPLIKSGLLEQIIESIPASDPRWWSHEKVDHHLDMMVPSHRARVEELSKGRSWAYRTFYRRMRSGQQRAEVRQDDTAGCLRTAVGGSSRQFLIAAGFEQVRLRNMTSREYARLQGVPDDYPINVEENQALTGFGDAVCVPAITWIARNVLNPLVDVLVANVSQETVNYRAT